MKIVKPDDLNKVNNIASIKKDDNTILIDKEDNRRYIGSFHFNPSDTKDIKKFIKAIERTIRTSPEYKRYIGILSNKYNITNDQLMSNISSDSATLEFHHYPFTLYDIVEIVLNQYMMEDIPVTSMDIAETVMKLHYANMVGLVRLSKTNHELAHSGGVTIPMNMVFGDVNSFINKYDDYIYDDHRDKYNKLIDHTNSTDSKNEFYTDSARKRIKKDNEEDSSDA